MSERAWRYALASVIGTGHVRASLPCQDRSACELITTEAGETVLVAIAADGAGSASHSQFGAELACGETLAELRTHFDAGNGMADLSQEFATQSVQRLQAKITICAEAENLRPRDFACTLLVAVVGERRIVTWQIGDGAIIYSDPNRPDDYSVVNWSEKEEYENVTVFVTQPIALDHLQFDAAESYVDEIAILTDGIQRLALDFKIQNAHAPFFRSMFAPLRREDAGLSKRASSGLAALLDSPRVNERTDDDKTLILASRRPILPVCAPAPLPETQGNEGGMEGNKEEEETGEEEAESAERQVLSVEEETPTLDPQPSTLDTSSIQNPASEIQTQDADHARNDSDADSL